MEIEERSQRYLRELTERSLRDLRANRGMLLSHLEGGHARLEGKKEQRSQRDPREISCDRSGGSPSVERYKGESPQRDPGEIKKIPERFLAEA